MRSYTFFRITSCSWLSWLAWLRDLFLESPTVVLLMASSRRSNWQEMARDRTTIGRLSENCCNRVRATIGFGRRPVPVVKHSNLNPKCLLTWVKICAVHLYLAPGTVGQSWDLPDSARFRHKTLTVVPFTDDHLQLIWAPCTNCCTWYSCSKCLHTSLTAARVTRSSELLLLLLSLFLLHFLVLSYVFWFYIILGLVF